MRWRPVGDAAILVDSSDPPSAAAALRRLAAAAGIALVDVVPGAETVLVVASSPSSLPALTGEVGRAGIPPAQPTACAGAVEVPVRYDGDDLDEVAARLAMTAAELVALHTGATYRGAFSGFAPGFCYLSGVPEALRLPRRSQPRTRVPAGSVAVAGGWAAVYPRPTPGGWLLLGTTDFEVWDPARDPPALIGPGVEVRFRDAGQTTCT